MDDDFSSWRKSFRKTIAQYTYYVDFDKVYNEVNEMKDRIELMNKLIGSSTIKEDFLELATHHPEVLKCIPALIAVSDPEIYVDDDGEDKLYDFDKGEQPLEEYAYFLERSGLFELLSKNHIRDLYDYIIGVSVGLDSNSRKNRTGERMEEIVCGYLQESGLEFYKQMSMKRLDKDLGTNISNTYPEDIKTKKFDFIVLHKGRIYAIETNFYRSGGSKPSETVRSYIGIQNQARNVPGFKFVWITDGKGWEKHEKPLKKAYDNIESIHTLRDLEEHGFRELLGL